MLFLKLCVLPLMFPLISITTIVISYGMAVAYGHINPLFPYISDMGSTAPESCLFSMGLSTATIFLVWMLYVRHVQTQSALREERARAEAEAQAETGGGGGSSSGRLRRWRRGELCGLVAALSAPTMCVGILMVANFQKTHCNLSHLVGAFLYIGAGAVYACCQVELDISFHNIESHEAQHLGYSNNLKRVHRITEPSTCCLRTRRLEVVQWEGRHEMETERRRFRVPRCGRCGPVADCVVPLVLRWNLLLRLERTNFDTARYKRPEPSAAAAAAATVASVVGADATCGADVVGSADWAVAISGVATSAAAAPVVDSPGTVNPSCYLPPEHTTNSFATRLGPAAHVPLRNLRKLVEIKTCRVELD